MAFGSYTDAARQHAFTMPNTAPVRSATPRPIPLEPPVTTAVLTEIYRNDMRAPATRLAAKRGTRLRFIPVA